MTLHLTLGPESTPTVPCVVLSHLYVTNRNRGQFAGACSNGTSGTGGGGLFPTIPTSVWRAPSSPRLQ